MITTETKLKSWGNSIGVVLPKDELKAEHLEVNDEVEVTVKKKSNPIKEAFGKLKGVKGRTGRSTEELVMEAKRELDSRWG